MKQSSILGRTVGLGSGYSEGMHDRDRKPLPTEIKPLTVDEIAETMTTIFDTAADTPEFMRVTKNLMTVFAAHLSKDGMIYVPEQVVQREFLGAITTLEMRIAAIEDALKDAGIEVETFDV